MPLPSVSCLMPISLNESGIAFRISKNFTVYTLVQSEKLIPKRQKYRQTVFRVCFQLWTQRCCQNCVLKYFRKSTLPGNLLYRKKNVFRIFIRLMPLIECPHACVVSQKWHKKQTSCKNVVLTLTTKSTCCSKGFFLLLTLWCLFLCLLLALFLSFERTTRKSLTA